MWVRGSEKQGAERYENSMICMTTNKVQVLVLHLWKGSMNRCAPAAVQLFVTWFCHLIYVGAAALQLQHRKGQQTRHDAQLWLPRNLKASSFQMQIHIARMQTGVEQCAGCH
jgi:hypothetical protein